MRLLEQALEVKLFVRKGRQMQLTHEGEVLHQACQDGFSTILSGLNSIKSEGIEGELVVSSTQAFCALWLMPRIYQFSQAHPEINLSVQGSNQVEDLQQKQIDVAVRFSTSTERLLGEGLVVEHIDDDKVLPVISPKLASTLALEQPSDLLKCRLIGLVNESKVNWRTWLTSVGVEKRISNHNLMLVTSSDLALSAVLSGHGAMLASKTMVGAYIDSGQLIVPFNLTHPDSWKTHLVYLKDSAKRERIQIFCDWVKSQMEIENKQSTR